MGRSSKEMPKNWRQLKSEILWQYLGVRGLIEDYYLRNCNRVGESNIITIQTHSVRKNKLFVNLNGDGEP